MNDQKIKVIHKKEYGKNRYYPARYDALESVLLKNMKRKSFTSQNLIDLKSSGFEIEIESEKPILK